MVPPNRWVRRWMHRGWVLLCLALFVGLTYAIPNRLYQRLPRFDDELAELWQARVFALGRLAAPPAPVPAAFAVTHIIQLAGHRFSKYPPGFALVLTLGVLIGEPWIIAPWLLALTLAVTYRFAQELFDARHALLAVTLAATSPMWLMLGTSLLQHSAGVLAATVYLWGVYRMQGLIPNAPPPASRWAWVSGIALGYLLCTRSYTALLLTLPWGSVAAIEFLRQPQATLRRYAPIVVCALVGVGLQLSLNYFYTHTFTPSLYTLADPYDRLGFGPDVSRNGYYLSDAVKNLQLGFLTLNYDLHGWLFASLLLPTLGLVLPPYNKRTLYLASFPLCVIIGHAAYFHLSRFFGPRLYMEGTVPLFFLSALGLLKLHRFLGGVARAPRPLWHRLTGVAVNGLVLVGFIFNLTLYLPWRFSVLANPLDYNQQLSWAPVTATRTAKLSNAIVFIFSQRWLTLASGNLTNSVLLDDDVLFACYAGPEVFAAVQAAFPERTLYYWDPPQLTPATAPRPGGEPCDT